MDITKKIKKSYNGIQPQTSCYRIMGENRKKIWLAVSVFKLINSSKICCNVGITRKFQYKPYTIIRTYKVKNKSLQFI